MSSLVRNMSANALTAFAGDVLLSLFITERQKKILTWLKFFLSPNEDSLSSVLSVAFGSTAEDHYLSLDESFKVL